MGEAQRRGVTGGIVGEQAPRLFVKAWIEAQHETEVVFTDGQVGDAWMVVGTIGRFTAAMTPDQARATAERFVAFLENPDVAPMANAIGDVVVALRQAADEVERLHPASGVIVVPERPRLVLPGLGG